MIKPIEIGKRYGKLIIVSEMRWHISPSGRRDRVVKCQCDCGKFIEVLFSSLKNKRRTHSCGCHQIETIRAANTKHGLSYHPLYKRLLNMKNRCYYTKDISYSNYGGRGIKVCDEWLNDFQTFYNWGIANGWEEGLQIDRIDNNGNYEPSNCRFVTSQDNIHNQSTTKLNWEDVRDIRNIKLLIPGIKNTELAKAFKVGRRTISGIINNEIWKES